MPPSPGMSKRAKACEQCRQQKLKCDAHLHYLKQCSRCRKSGTDCIFTSNFKRRKTRFKWEMQREIESLRRSANNEASAGKLDFAAPSITALSLQTHLLPPSSLASSVPNGSRSEITYPPVDQATSFSPTLEGISISPHKLDDCLELYFKHYHPILPILEPQYGCRDYFTYSPVLFWTMIVTGSRRYALDPTLLEILAPKVANLAALATIRVSDYLQTISAFLILCAWPLPMENASDDPSPVYAGVIMQLSLQNGLHMLSKRQDFSQNNLVRDRNQEISRARLWAWCKVICHCTNIFSGLHHHTFEDAFELEPYCKDNFGSLDPTYWMQRLNSVMSKALQTLMQIKYERDEFEQLAQLLSVTKFFDEEVLRIKRQCQDLLCDIWFSSIRLHICVYYFFPNQSTLKSSNLIELYYIACRFIDNITSRDRQDDYALYLSEQYFRTLTLAAMTILRIYRSTELSSKVDLLLGEQSYFAAIQILKKRGLKNNDLNARTAVMFSQLWQSKRIFRKQDGSIDSLNVRIRSRGGMGIAYDCFWYWRNEFLGQANPYQEEVNEGPSNTAISAASFNAVETESNIEEATNQIQELDENCFQNMAINDAFFSEWNWSTDGYLPGELSGLGVTSTYMPVN